MATWEMYKYGTGVAKDYKQAIQWLKLSGDTLALNELAGLQDRLIDWDDKDNSALTVLVDIEKSIKTYITTEVSFSSDGHRNLYFTVPLDKLKCKISTDSGKPSTEIWYFNKQAVKMNKWCNKYSDSEGHYLSLTPQSNQGFKFVVSTFKKSAKSVSIKSNNFNFEVSSKGFTKTWNSVSPKAL